MKKLLLFSILLPVLGFSQLTQKRVDWIKKTTVKICAEDGTAAGTGFFIDDKATVVTCMHVVQSFIVSGKAFYAKLSNGDTIHLGVPTIFTRDTLFQKMCLGYDLFISGPLVKNKYRTPYLSIGDFNKIDEGSEIYTCGYPLTLERQFIAKGIVSTKYTDSTRYVYSTTGGILYTPISEALLDITFNRGCSGSPIVKLGKNPEDDEVIGVGDFIIAPFGGPVADSVIQLVSSYRGGIILNVQEDPLTGRIIGGNNPNDIISLLARAMTSVSVGIAGCVSSNHITELLSRIRSK